MITTFEDKTYELTEGEQSYVPELLDILKQTTKDAPLKEPQILTLMENKISGARLRKLTHHIRHTGLAPVIATSKGYFISYDKEVIKKQIKSLRERARSIEEAANGLMKFT